jgi:hypothetical protein
MLNVVLASVALCLWVASYAAFFARDVRTWARERPYRRLIAEMERLEAVQAYAAWVRNMPSPPPRPYPGPALRPTPERPVVLGGPGPYPGRRFLGD